MKWASQDPKQIPQCRYWDLRAVQEPAQRTLLQNQDLNFFFFLISGKSLTDFQVLPHSTRLCSQECKLFSQPCLTPALILSLFD